ncbi:hypothetical protein LSS_21640 [Leptospira santarosai serovar Shermani str. LT 821]|uniref:Uncharacterized protein n=1 Tax=Leptospira santarosai serovar Shermani str. LT 821 TaxID=758847 RepID=A0A097ESI9_9LEPT|nr:hypothetical protein LSS_21640 [Leptospira santarosai serovar Shermani str. LT 821]
MFHLNPPLRIFTRKKARIRKVNIKFHYIGTISYIKDKYPYFWRMFF